MTALRNAIIAYNQDMKGIQVGSAAYPARTGVPMTLKDLLFKPNDDKGNTVQDFDPYTQRGWRGPYVLQASGSFTTRLDTSFLPTRGFPFAYPYGNPTTNPPDPAFLDAWGIPIVLQWPQTADPVTTQAQYVRLVSAGPPSKTVNGSRLSAIDTLATTLMPTQPTATQPTLVNQRGNDLIMFLFVQDQYP
jgi:hypothetical protein